MRSFPVSVTYTFTPASVATPCGPLNWPLPLPTEPHAVTNAGACARAFAVAPRARQRTRRPVTRTAGGKIRARIVLMQATVFAHPGRAQPATGGGVRRSPAGWGGAAGFDPFETLRSPVESKGGWRRGRGRIESKAGRRNV